MADETLLVPKEEENHQPSSLSVPPEMTGDASTAKKKRLCRYPGCTRVIKSQGHCQRHGAKAKRCKVDGCDKQAQGTHDGMCKRHWKTFHGPDGVPLTSTGASQKSLLPPAPEGDSVYDSVLPQSISYRPTKANPPPEVSPGEDPPLPPSDVSIMPLVDYLRDGAVKKQQGWHRNSERRARGLFPVSNLQLQLEPWERQLALVEILLLSGGTPYANFSHLAHAWGREKGFHHMIAQNVCERRGEVERKRRSTQGNKSTNGKKPRRPTNSDSSGENDALENDHGQLPNDNNMGPPLDVHPMSVAL